MKVFIMSVGELLVIFCFAHFVVEIYRNDPKFSDRLVWANSADPDHTALRGAV